ncbi:MAG: hypothetical protein WDZ42_02435 [Candidatus Saccharimonadales bacterium]
MMKKSLNIALLILTIISYPSLVLSQNNSEIENSSRTGLSVSPAIFEMVVSPGEIGTQTIYISNISDQPTPFITSVENLHLAENLINPSLSNNFNASSWISLPNPYHILDSTEQRSIEVVVEVPDTAEPGGHYASIVLRPLEEVSSDDTGARIVPQIGVIAFITVPGDTDTEFSVDKPSVNLINSSSEIDIDINFRNTGNIHILPTAKTEIKSILGSADHQINIAPRVVLPNTTKISTATWDDPPIIGAYSAQVIGSYGSDQTSLVSDKSYFIIIRWLPLFASILLVVIASIFILKTHKRWPRAYRAFVAGSHISKSEKSNKKQ